MPHKSQCKNSGDCQWNYIFQHEPNYEYTLFLNMCFFCVYNVYNPCGELVRVHNASKVLLYPFSLPSLSLFHLLISFLFIVHVCSTYYLHTLCGVHTCKQYILIPFKFFSFFSLLKSFISWKPSQLKKIYLSLSNCLSFILFFICSMDFS